MSLISILVGGFIERAIVKNRFDQAIMAQTMRGFIAEAIAYHEEYGSWEAAVAAEPFPVFGARFRPANITVFRSEQAASEDQILGPPPQGQLPPGTMAGMAPAGQGMGPPVNVAAGAPQYRVADTEGRIWIGAPQEVRSPPLDQDTLDKAVPLMSDGELIGYGISVDRIVMTDLEEQYLQTMLDSVWISLALVGAGAIPIGIFLGAWLSSPIRKLHQAVVAMQPGAVHQEVPVTSDDELGELTKSFNVMSSEMASFVQIIEEQKEKILETEALRKEGMASFSHELRTPLNNCVAQANAMLDGIRPRDDEQMNLLSNSLDHLTRLVDDLFQLALADVNALDCAEDVVNLAELSREAVEARQPDFSQAGSTLVKDIPGYLDVVGDAKRLRQIIDNLLENCFRYAIDRAEIRVILRPAGNLAELTISDNGPGVPEETLDSLFDRFYRADESRDRKTGGTGLGLSLVKAWAEAQGGTVRAFLSAQGGLGISVCIPLARSGRLDKPRAAG